MKRRSTLPLLVSVLLVSQLSGCFKAISTSAGSSKNFKSPSKLVSVAAESETKSVADISFNATETQTISVSGNSTLSGTSVGVSPGALSISTSIIIEEGSSFADQGMNSEISLSDNTTITAAGSGVIVRPSTEVTLTKPLQLSLPVPVSAGLRLSSVNYAVSFKYLDPAINQLVTGIKPVDGDSVKIVYDESAKKDAIQFEGYFGIYWIVTLSREMAKAEIPETKPTLNPIMNKANVPVIASNGIVKETDVVVLQAKPETVWQKPALTFDTATRKVTLTPAAAIAGLKACRAEYFRSANDLSGLSIDLGDLKASTIDAANEKYQLVGRFRCLDALDRMTMSPWSEALAIPAFISPVVNNPGSGSNSGNPGSGGGTNPTPADTTPPTVLSVSSPSANGTYGEGQTLHLSVNFSEAVNVTGTPTLTLQTAPNLVATYASGSGGSVLDFVLTIVGGFNLPALDYENTTALSGNIKDLAGNSANLTLALPGSTGSLSSNKSIAIDTVRPSVTSVSSSNPDGVYSVNASITVQVNFSEAVTVTGATPTLDLNTSPTRTVNYVSGSGTQVLSFLYVVAAGETSADLDIFGTASLNLNTATIKDAAGNYAIVTLPSPGSANSLSSSRNIQINGNVVAPNLVMMPPTQNVVLGQTISNLSVNDNTTGNDTTSDGSVITYSCLFDELINGIMDGGGQDCSLLPNGASFNTASGDLMWNPSGSWSIPYNVPKEIEVKVIGTNSFGQVGFVYGTYRFIKPFSNMIGFDAGTNASYQYPAGSMEFTGGTVKLMPKDQTDDSNNPDEFGSATLRGLSYDGSIPGIRTGNLGGCDGQTMNCSALEKLLAPQNNAILYNVEFDDGGSAMLTSGAPPTYSMVEKKLGQKSAQFSGSGQFLSSTLKTPTDFTYNIWIKTSDVSGTCSNWFQEKGLIASYDSNQATQSWGLTLCEGKAKLGFNSGSPVHVPTTQVIADNKWHMLTVTRLATGVMALFVDGELKGTFGTFSGAWSAINEVTYGAMPVQWSFYTGYMDAIKVWTVALSAEEIKMLYDREWPSSSGLFTSRVFDTGSPMADWNELKFRSTLPFGKELPNSGTSDSPDYALYNSSLMMNNFGLWHLNETSGDYLNSSASVVLPGTYSDPGVRTNPGVLGVAPQFSGTGGILLGDVSSWDLGSSYSLTVSAWIKTSKSTGSQTILQNGFAADTTPGFKLLVKDGKITFGLCNSTSSTTCTVIQTDDVFADGKWHHVVGSLDRAANRMKIYVDGLARNLSVDLPGLCGALNAAEIDIGACQLIADRGGYFNPTIGGTYSSSTFINTFEGQIDELALWTRALSANEILQLYRRVANKALFQVRSCNNPACSTEAFVGPDGTSRTFYSEEMNMTPSSALFNLNNVPNIGANRYIQYRLVLESWDQNTLCNQGGVVNCSPEVKEVMLAPLHYPMEASISYNMPIDFFSLQNLNETFGISSCPTGVRYALSTNNASYFYYSGSSWMPSSGTSAQASTSSQMNAGLPQFRSQVGSGSLWVKAILTSSGSTPCELDNIAVNGNSSF